jgi:helicase required for RNAi-mediated heterochromatin assembly 1
MCTIANIGYQTGKTFVSISALRVMLDNWKPGDPPILVSAQTNHAIDQLLSLIEPFEANFLRLGGRYSEDNEVVQVRTLHAIRTQAPPGASGGDSSRRIARDCLEKLAEEIIGDIQDMNDQGPEEASHFRDLQLITQEQFDSLNDSSWVDLNTPILGLEAWLSGQQSPARCCPLNNNGFGEEEEDLEYEILNETEMEARKAKDEDEDMEALKGTYFPYRRTFIGKASRRCSELRAKQLLETTPNLWEIDEDKRGSVYQYLKNEASKEHLAAFRERMAEYVRGVNNIKIARWKANATLIRTTGVKLIGCTTTGLSKYRGLLACLKPRTLLIEEAAETLEGTILAAIFESLEQLILVGDHLQLQAHCNLSQLGKAPFNLSMSLFERFINNGIEFTMLNTQRRMITEIRSLLSPLYPGLQDHVSVLDRRNRPPVPGMGGRDSFFFHHTWSESIDDARSRYNFDEANLIASFFNYLVLNGVDASKMTILTFYHGQRKLLLRLLKRIPNLSMRGPFNVFTVDSYQGEENNIIMLSLVRSNEEGAIGFIENRNRSVVALSRARCGMYIFGNCVNLLRSNAESHDLWYGVFKKMQSQGRCGIDSGFPIVCSAHSTETVIWRAEDLEALSGGCMDKCRGALPCGHQCPFTCHP